ncbi:hypothetical protein [Miltoncostaea oceani]|uniref:hypothetical protein n=1 Tax=Miltoncostaea oceani TaxID=2843216 RepID=UPI001C3DCE3D|nr:hypothetical protein [Miltoncostaea oceani]
MSELSPGAGIEALARILSGPHEQRNERLTLLRDLLGAPGGGWSPGQIRQLSRMDDVRTQRALVSLKRTGSLQWDAQRSRYLVPADQRPVLTALYLLSGSRPAAELVELQGALFGIAADSDDGDLTLAGLIDLLEEDVLTLEAIGQGQIEDALETARQIERHVDDAERLLERLGTDDHGRRYTERAVELVSRLALGVSGVLENLSRESADRMPRAGGASAADLRAKARSLSLEQLASLLGGRARPAPRMHQLPDPRALAAALLRLSDRDRPSALPEPEVTQAVEAAEPQPDSLERLYRNLGAREQVSFESLIGECGDWGDALSLQHGFVRLHETLLGREAAGISSDGSVLVDPSPAVRLASRASVDAWKEAAVHG